MYKITKLHLGAVPTGSVEEGADREVVIHVFAKDVFKRSSSRFQCLYEGLRQPSSGTLTVPLHGVVTDHIVLRGTYQTVPVTIYGFKLDSIADLRNVKSTLVDRKYDTDIIEYTGSGKNMVCGVFLKKEHIELLDVLGNDTSTAEQMVSALRDGIADDIYEDIWFSFPIIIERHDLHDQLISAVNKAVSWISLFLSNYNLGTSCVEVEIDLGSYGLDILAIAFQHYKIASEFVANDGGLILRSILSTRGLPGSFYNKAIALAALLLKQSGAEGCHSMMRDTFSKFRLLHGETFFPCDDSPEHGAKGKRTRNADAVGKKRARKKLKLDGRCSKDLSNFLSTLEKIENREAVELESDFWVQEAASRDTIAEVMMRHAGRFKPNFTSSQHSFFMDTLDFHVACKTIVQILEDLCELLSSESSSRDKLLETGAILSQAMDTLLSQMAHLHAYKVPGDVQEFLIEEDTSTIGKRQIFALCLEHHKIPEELHRVLDFASSYFHPDTRTQVTCEIFRKFNGLISKVVVDFLSNLLKSPEFLTPSSLHHLKDGLQSTILSSEANPNKFAFNGLNFELDLYLQSSRRLAKLATGDWSAQEHAFGDLLISDISPIFVHYADNILQKCEEILRTYSDATTQSKGLTLELQASFQVAQLILLELLAAWDANVWKCIIPHTAILYSHMDSILNSGALVDSPLLLSQSQRILGGLFACKRVSLGGLNEAINLLCSQLPWVKVEDNSERCMDQSEYFESLDAICFGNTLSVSMSWDEIRLLLDDSERLGQIITSLHFLRTYLHNSEDNAMIAQKSGGNQLLLRTLLCATEIFSASMADNMWLQRIGTAMDTYDIMSNKLMALIIMESVTACVCSYIESVSNQTNMDSTALLFALIKAHAAVSTDSQAMLDIGQRETHDYFSRILRKTRWNLVASLRSWIDSPRMRPKVIPTALTGAISAPVENGCAVSFSPAALLSISTLLGDIFPSEWPKLGHKNHLSSDDKRYRAALTEEIESCIASFEHYVSSCILSETLYLQSSSLRFLSKGAGLGGGMGTFLMGIISSRFNEMLTPPAFGSFTWYDLRRILEILVPLMYQPSLKAAALDTSVPLNLARLVEKIIQQSLQPGSNFDGKEASSILTMALECITVLCDPSVTLDVFKINASSLDVIGKDAGSLISCIILDHIAVLGENIPLALNILQTMVKNRIGRDNVRHGIIQLCTKSQGEHIEYPTNEQIITAAQWLVHQYRTIQNQSSDPTVKFVFESLENILKEACISNHYDGSLGPLEQARPAPARFAMVAKEASSRGLKEGIKRKLKGSYLDLFQDCESIGIFWMNQNLRQIHNSSTGAHAAKLSKYIGWDIGQEMDKFCMADILHPWLTHPVRPLNERMNAQHQADEYQAEDGYIEVGPSETENGQDPTMTGIVADTIDSQVIVQPQQVDIGSLSEVLKTKAEDIEQPIEDEEEIDLYADLYQDLDAPKTEEVGGNITLKQEEECCAQDDQENERVQINFEEDGDSSDSKEDDPEANPEEIAEESELLTTEPVKQEHDAAPAYLQDDLKELLKDQRKVEELLVNNPALLAQLKERLRQKLP